MDALAQLTSIHDDLLGTIQKLDAVTRCDRPDPSELGIARWKLTRASRARWRILDDVIYPEIERRSFVSRPDVTRLRSADAAIRTNSSNHIAKWDAECVLRQWPEYQAASAGVIASMRDRVAQEQAVLYPLLADGAG